MRSTRSAPTVRAGSRALICCICSLHFHSRSFNLATTGIWPYNPYNAQNTLINIAATSLLFLNSVCCIVTLLHLAYAVVNMQQEAPQWHRLVLGAVCVLVCVSMLVGGGAYYQSGNLDYHRYAVTGAFAVGVVVVTSVFDVLAIWVLRYADDSTVSVDVTLRGHPINSSSLGYVPNQALSVRLNLLA